MMLLSQRKALCFSIVIALFLSSCIPVSMPQNGFATPIADVTIPATCLTENAQTYIASNKAYCFAYPFGYMVGSQSSPDSLSITQASVGGVPAVTINANNMNDVLQAIPGGITLLLRYEDRHIDDHLQDLVYKHPDDFYTPWVIDGTEAVLVRATRDNVISYTIHAKNGDLYYQIMFSSPAGLTSGCASSSELEELFFLVVATFTFLN